MHISLFNKQVYFLPGNLARYNHHPHHHQYPRRHSNFRANQVCFLPGTLALGAHLGLPKVTLAHIQLVFVIIVINVIMVIIVIIEVTFSTFINVFNVIIVIMFRNTKSLQRNWPTPVILLLPGFHQMVTTPHYQPHEMVVASWHRYEDNKKEHHKEENQC